MLAKVGKEELELLNAFVSKVNEDIVKKFGGACGLVNIGNLSYCLWNALREARKHKHEGKFHKIWAGKTLVEIAQKHPFTDGNKRTSYAIARLILYLGKMDFEVNYERATNFLRKVASGKIGFDEVLKWIEKHTVPLENKINPEIGEFVGMLAQVAEEDGLR